MVEDKLAYLVYGAADAGAGGAAVSAATEVLGNGGYVHVNCLLIGGRFAAEAHADGTVDLLDQHHRHPQDHSRIKTTGKVRGTYGWR